MPSTSAFARIFQFGMRLGLRSWTIGSAWWQADCGPYWGHNAVIRVAPFKQHCAIPVLAGNGLLRGHVLSHDQIEAALDAACRLRRSRAAGGGPGLGGKPAEPHRIHSTRPALVPGNASIRVLCRPPRTGRRQSRSAPVRHADVPGLARLDRPPARVHVGPGGDAFADCRRRWRLRCGAAGYILSMWFAPKIATIIDVLSRPTLRRRFGGTWRFLAASSSNDRVPAALADHVDGHTLVLADLPFGRVIGWIGQVRNDHSVSWSTALRNLWPQTTLGAASLDPACLQQPEALPYVFVLRAGGLALSIPLCVITSCPSLGLAWRASASVAFPRKRIPRRPGASRASGLGPPTCRA